MESTSKDNHFKSMTHTQFNDSFISRYVVWNLDLDKGDEILTKFVNICNKHFEERQVRSFLKLLNATNRARYIRTKPRSILLYKFYIPRKVMLSKTNQDQVIERRISFKNSFRDTT